MPGSTVSPSRREFLVASSGVSALAWHRLGAQQETPRPPNIIFILADDLGYGDLGCYGQTKIATPHIDQMAAEGMRFTQHYAGSTVCAPSRCALMTGKHMGHARIRGNARFPILPEDNTVAEMLKRAGYTSALVGKWGLGEEDSVGIPNRKGFDHFFGYLNQGHAHNYYPEFLWRNTTKVALRNEVIHSKGRDGKERLNGAATKRLDYSADLCAEDALAFIRENRENHFFLYYATTLPHANNEAGLAKRHGMEVPDYGPYAKTDWPEAQKGHAAMITRLDRHVGTMLRELKTLGLDERTLVIFTSDNGPHREGGADPDFFDCNGPLRGIKRDLYEGGIRVPMVARWPGRIAPGSTSDHISAFWDFLPTACDVAGLDAPGDIDGVSYLPELLGKPQKAHDYLYWEFGERGGRLAVRFGPWKAVKNDVKRRPAGPWEIYNLTDDLGETHNVAAQHPEVVKRADSILKEAHTDSEHFKILPPENSLAWRRHECPAPPPKPDLYMSDLTPTTATSGYEPLGPPKMDASIRGEQLRVADKPYEKGIGVHAVSEITYEIQPGWQRFVASVGVDDEMKGKGGTVVFSVFADSEKLTDTPIMPLGELWHINVALPAGAKKLVLKVDHGGDGIGADHGDWLNAGVITK